MGHALGNVLPLAVAVAVFPVPIIAAVLIVGSDRGVAKGLAFLLAWCAGLGAVGTIGLLIGGVAGGSDAREPATWVNVLLLVLGVLLLWLAVKQWRARPSAGEEPPVPGWMRTVGDLTVAKAAGTGFALSALNPKNALLAIAAAVEIIEAGLSARQQVVVLVVFVVIASVGVLAPVALAVVLGERSRGPLNGLRVWMARHNAAIMAVLFLLIGAKLIGDAVAGFST